MLVRHATPTIIMEDGFRREETTTTMSQTNPLSIRPLQGDYLPVLLEPMTITRYVLYSYQMLLNLCNVRTSTGTKLRIHSLNCFYDLQLQLMGKLTHSESVMKLALSSFKDLSPCDSLSWISTFDDIDFQDDTALWGFDSSTTSASTGRRYHPQVARLDPQVVDYLSAPSMTAQRNPHAKAFASGSVRKPAPVQATKSRVDALAPDRKRKRIIRPTGQDEDTKNIYDSPNFIEDEPTEHDVFLGRGGKANTHIGNFYWLEEKAKLQPLYFDASKGTKKDISQQLVDRIHSKGGRFLQPVKFQDKPPVYRYIAVVDNNTLLKKASQTLRETNATDVHKAKRQKQPPPDAAEK